MTRFDRYKLRKPWVRYVQWSKDRCRRQPGYRGMENTLTVAQAEILWKRDGAAKMRKPSLDRKITSRGYAFDNCQFMEFSANVAKRNRENGYRTMANLLPDTVEEDVPEWVTEG